VSSPIPRRRPRRPRRRCRARGLTVVGRATREGDVHRRSAAGVVDRVDSRAALDRVGTGTAVEDVVLVVAGERVGTRAATQVLDVERDRVALARGAVVVELASSSVEPRVSVTGSVCDE
jgi:hypothetical protein